MGARILVAEDDIMQRNLLQLYLEREGHSVQAVGDGRSAIERFRVNPPDLVILDVMMPLVDGLDVCRILRTESEVPILLLTARSAEEDILLGLDLGADDYVTKPFSPRQLTARVRAMLRRTASRPVDQAVLTVGALEVDPGRFQVRIHDRIVPLTAKEFAVLEVLAAAPGRVFTRSQIIDQAFGYGSDVLGRTVDAHVTKLRRKLEDGIVGARDAPQVETVYGRGYRLTEPPPREPLR